MLLCFGTAWPVSIYKSWTSRQTGGKSVFFLFIVWLGYVAGTLHKVFFLFDAVIVLYILNATMVGTDIILFFRNRRIERREAGAIS
jgi:hypothetical protein